MNQINLPRERVDVRPEPDISASQLPGLQINPVELVAELEQTIERGLRFLVARERIVQQSIYALLTREHQLIVGASGTAKTLLAEGVMALFRDDQGVYFNQLTSETTEGQLLAGLDYEQFRKGIYYYNPEGRLLRARLAILDEVFDANDYTLRSLNGVLNERVFRRGMQAISTDLHTVIATSNYLRRNKATEAVLDRFVFKSEPTTPGEGVDQYLVRRGFLEHRGRPPFLPEEERYPFAKLRILSEIVRGEHPEHKITYPRAILFMMNEIYAEHERLNAKEQAAEGPPITISERTRNKGLHVLAASALRRGATAVDAHDLAALQYLVPIVGNMRDEACFESALTSTLRTYPHLARSNLERLLETVDLLFEAIERKGHGELEEPSFQEKLVSRARTLLGFETPSAVTIRDVLTHCRALKPPQEKLVALQAEVIERVEAQAALHGISLETVVIRDGR